MTDYYAHTIRESLAAYKDASDYYVDEDGCSYEDAAGLLQCGLLGFCGCGMGDDNLAYILGGLELLADKGPTRQPYDSREWEAWWEAQKQRVDAHHGHLVAAYFFYYWCDKEKLTDHGVGVPGWLTPKGEAVLQLLREWDCLPDLSLPPASGDSDA